LEWKRKIDAEKKDRRESLVDDTIIKITMYDEHERRNW
jgi:hypothetical protein